MTHAHTARRARGAVLLAGLMTVALGVSCADAAPASAPAEAPTSAAAQPRAVAAAPDARRKLSPAAKVRRAVRGARHGMRIPRNTRPSLRAAKGDLGDVGACDYSNNKRRLCPRGDRKNAKRRVVLIGDSHGRFWIPAFERLSWKYDWEAFYLVKEQCTAAYVLPAQNGNGRPNRACRDFQRWSARKVDQLNPDLVVVSTSAPSAGVYIGGKRVRRNAAVASEMRKGYRRLFRRLKPLAPRVNLVKDAPRSKTDPISCLRKRRRNDLGDCLFKPAPQSDLMARQSVVAAKNNGVGVVDPKRWLCWDNTCPAVVANRYVTYRDRGHLTGTYARTLALVLARDLRMR